MKCYVGNVASVTVRSMDTCSLGRVHDSFRGIDVIHLQGGRVIQGRRNLAACSSLALSSTLRKEAVHLASMPIACELHSVITLKTDFLIIHY
jgi:hypothetical protein